MAVNSRMVLFSLIRLPWSLSRLLRVPKRSGSIFLPAPPGNWSRSLGCVLFHGETAGILVETEAYLGIDDLAAHASRGLTPRTKVIFGPAGRAYVYFIYGMHECLNVVADREGVPGCVLIRALEPLCGLKQMARRRNWNGPTIGLANGPGKLTQALAITRDF